VIYENDTFKPWKLILKNYLWMKKKSGCL